MDPLRGLPTVAFPDFALPEVPTGFRAEVGGVGAGRVSVAEAAQEFEAYFLSYMMGVMRETVPDGMLDSKSSKVFYSFYDAEIGREAARSGGLGLAKSLVATLAPNPLENEAKIPLKFEAVQTDMTSEKVEGAPGDQSIGGHPVGRGGAHHGNF